MLGDRLLAIRVGVAGIVLATVCLGPSPQAASGADGTLDQLAAEVEGVAPDVARARFDEYRRRLLTVQGSVERWDRFIDSYGDRPQVRAILNGLDEEPGDEFIVEESDIAALESAVGGGLDLSRLDAERCARVGDLGADPQPPGAVAASLGKCLRALDRVGPNGAGVAILERAESGLADDTFTSAGMLARLEGAVGDLPLTARDLETCVDAFHANAALEPDFESYVLSVGTPGAAVAAQTCQAGETPCTTALANGRSWTECCAPGQTCERVGAPGVGVAGTCKTPACFPATAKVRLEDGAEKAMADVRLGDRVLVARADGSLGHEEIYLNTHKDAAAAAPYVELALASGRTLTLSPRHFIPTAGAAGEAFAANVVKAADEVRVGDLVWSRGGGGALAADAVVGARTKVAVGAYNPLTMNGTIVVDELVASAHSDWFLDGLVSADTEARVYQAILAPARLAYRALGPARMEAITEGWGVVDLVREATTPGGRGTGLGWAWLALPLLAGGGLLVLRRRRAAAH
jgi:hypothetical protein